MKKGKLLSAAVVVLGALLISAAAGRGQDPQEANYDTDEMMKLGAPGLMHQHLEPLVGSWEMTAKMRSAPGTDWEEESTSEAKREWICDRRFVKETVESDWMGMPFEGMGLFGYDNVREEYCFMWVDSMSTGMMFAPGTSTDGGKTITFEGTHADSMTGEKDAWFRHVMRIVSDDENVFEMYARDPSGEPFMTMEITSKRQ